MARGLDLDVDQVADAVRVAARHGLVQTVSALDRIEFRHTLIRDAVDGMLVRPRRAVVARSILAALPTVDGEPSGPVIEIAAALAREAGRRDLAATHYLRAARNAIMRGAVHSGTVLIEQAVALANDADLAVAARVASVDAHALTGHTARALREGEAVLRQLGGDPAGTAQVHLSMARAAAAGQLWPVAQLHLNAAQAALGEDRAAGLALRAVVALGAGRLADAVDQAFRAAARAEAENAPAVACEAYEVLGRAARGHDLSKAMSWFSCAAGVAERHGLSLWRARALHELATVSLLRDLSLNDLHQARQAAGAAGLLASVDFHIAAIHGVRFEPDLALAAGGRCLAEARRIGVVRQQAWGWILIGQAHACAGHRLQAATAAHEAVRLAQGDAEIAGLASGAYGVASLLAGDRARRCSSTGAASSTCAAAPHPVTPAVPVAADRTGLDRRRRNPRPRRRRRPCAAGRVRTRRPMAPGSSSRRRTQR